MGSYQTGQSEGSGSHNPTHKENLGKEEKEKRLTQGNECQNKGSELGPALGKGRESLITITLKVVTSLVLGSTFEGDP